jgi:hypothetical protein
MRAVPNYVANPWIPSQLHHKSLVLAPARQLPNVVISKIEESRTV